MTQTAVPPAVAGVSGEGSLVGTWALIRFALRRDRVRLPAWVLGIFLGLVVTAAGFPGLYPDAAARQARAALMSSPAAVALGGPQIGVADYTFGAMLTNEMLGFVAVLVALMSIFTVVRHTRADEELGRTELLLALPLGRHAPLAAALTVTALANLVLAVLTAVGLGGLGIEGVTWAGSVLFGAALAGVGLVFAGVAAVAAQVTEHARGASGLAGLALGVAYAVRAVGDVSGSAASWLSPIAWAQRTYAYVEDRWWPLLLPLATTALLVAATAALGSRRDLGAGLRQPRPGRSVASPLLASPTALAARLQRTALIAWVISFLAFGLVYGNLLGEVEGFADEMQDTVGALLGSLGEDLVNAFLALLVTMLAMTASIFAVVATLRAQAEESSGRAEVVLATPVSRARWASGHAGVAAVGAVATMLAGALGVGLSGSVALGDAGVLPRMLGGSLVQVAPVLLVVAVAVALYGLLPRATLLVWVVVLYGMVVGILGGLLGFPDWALELSPYSMVPMVPAEPFVAGPVLLMLAAAAGLYFAGIWGLRRRDVSSGA